MSKPTYKIIRNLPEWGSYGQYVHIEDQSSELFWNATGIGTPFNQDDLYTIIDTEDSISSTAGGNIYYPSWGGNTSGQLCISNSIYKDWRPISNIFTGNKLNAETGTYLQQYYSFDNPNYIKTSAPNIINLYFDFYDNDNVFDLPQDGGDFWNLLADSLNINSVNNAYSYAYTEEFLIPRLKVLSWDYKEGDYLNEDILSPVSPNDGGLLYNIISDGSNYTTENVIYSHQYNTPGIKTIKAIIYVGHQNPQGTSYVFHKKNLTIRFNLGIDDIYIEDFSILGGPDFTFLPWPNTSPIIGGISNESKYINSLQRVIKKN